MAIKKLIYVLSVLSFISATPLSLYASHTGGDGTRTSSWSESIEDLGDNIVQNIPIPVLFGVALKNITPNFGDPRAGHAHAGLDIMAREGTPIVSPVNAVVTRTGVYTGAGNFVNTAVPGGETFVYMHLSAIADIDEGDVLAPGDIIGYVGHTGNAIASAPHLHFEIRDASGTALDPYPRITKTFDLKDKIRYLDEILDDAADEDKLAELLVTSFRTDFTTAKAQGIVLPSSIEKAMVKISAPAPVVYGTSTGTLRVGSRGPQVVALQTFLIKMNVGSASRVVADGSFGPITRQALIDYQRSVGLVPDGVYGPKSHAYVLAHS